MHDLVVEALRPFGLEGDGGAKFQISGGPVRLKPNQALTIGIALHELATNAVKYGALSSASGMVQIAWENKGSPNGERLHLRWQESGGPVVVPPTRKGFGSRVIERGVPHELSAESRLDYDKEGVVCTIDMPGRGFGG